MSTINTIPLLEQLEQYNNEYNENPEQVLAQARAIAIEQALQNLLTNPTARSQFEEGAKTSSKEGKKTHHIATWSLTDGRKYNGRYLLDLLNKSELLGLMQDWLDEHYKTTDKQFKIFHCKVANTQGIFALIVSWDQSGFESIDQIIARNREMVNNHRATDEHEHRGGPRGPREHRGPRGGPREDREPREPYEHRGGPPREPREPYEHRGPPREPREPYEHRGPPREPYEHRGPPREPRAKYEPRGPPRARYEPRGPPREPRGPPRNFKKLEDATL